MKQVLEQLRQYHTVVCESLSFYEKSVPRLKQDIEDATKHIQSLNKEKLEVEEALTHLTLLSEKKERRNY